MNLGNLNKNRSRCHIKVLPKSHICLDGSFETVADLVKAAELYFRNDSNLLHLYQLRELDLSTSLSDIKDTELVVRIDCDDYSTENMSTVYRQVEHNMKRAIETLLLTNQLGVEKQQEVERRFLETEQLHREQTERLEAKVKDLESQLQSAKSVSVLPKPKKDATILYSGKSLTIITLGAAPVKYNLNESDKNLQSLKPI